MSNLRLVIATTSIVTLIMVIAFAYVTIPDHRAKIKECETTASLYEVIEERKNDNVPMSAIMQISDRTIDETIAPDSIKMALKDKLSKVIKDVYESDQSAQVLADEYMKKCLNRF